MATQIHAFGPNGELSPGAEAALEGLGGGVGGSTTVQIGTVTLPEDPTEGLSVSVLADSETVLPEDVTWDLGGEPAISGRLLIMFVWSGVDWVGTYGMPISAAPVEDTTGPTPGTLSMDMSDTTADGTVTGASDETALHATPYSFRLDGGAWSSWQSGATYEWAGLTAETEYDFQHRVRDAAGHIAEGSPVTDTTTEGSGGSVELTYRTSDGGHSLTAVDIGSASADRVVLVIFSGRNADGGGGGEAAPTDCTIGGVSATRDFYFDATNIYDQGFAVFRANVPSGSTADVSVSGAGIISASFSRLTVWTADAPVAFVDADVSAHGNTVSTTCDTSAGGFAIAAAAGSFGTGDGPWTGATVRNYVSFFTAADSGTDGSSKTITWAGFGNRLVTATYEAA